MVVLVLSSREYPIETTVCELQVWSEAESVNGEVTSWLIAGLVTRGAENAGTTANKSNRLKSFIEGTAISRGIRAKRVSAQELVRLDWALWLVREYWAFSARPVVAEPRHQMEKGHPIQAALWNYRSVGTIPTRLFYFYLNSNSVRGVLEDTVSIGMLEIYINKVVTTGSKCYKITDSGFQAYKVPTAKENPCICTIGRSNLSVLYHHHYELSTF
jgi:hypothetical protein